MKFIILTYLSIFSSIATAQITDDSREVIKKTLLDDSIRQKVFFTYDGSEWRGAFQLSAGTYAFIVPDTTFQKIYKGILQEFPYSIKTDGLLSMRRLYSDSTRTIYISGRVGPELCIVFRKIEIKSDSAIIEFFTTSFGNQKRFDERYIAGTAHLQKSNGMWHVKESKIQRIHWFEYYKMP